MRGSYLSDFFSSLVSSFFSDLAFGLLGVFLVCLGVCFLFVLVLLGGFLLLWSGLGKFLLFGQHILKAINASSGVYQVLLAGVKWVTI